MFFPNPHGSEFPWIGSPETVRETNSYLIANQEYIEVLGGWKIGENKLTFYAERAVIRIADEVTGELEYYDVNTLAPKSLDDSSVPSRESRWHIVHGPLSRDELVKKLTEHRWLCRGDNNLLPFLTDEALGWR